MNPEIKVIDNFLGIDEYKEMQKMLLAQSEKYHNFRWLFLESTVDYSHRPEVNMQTCDELDNFQFSHVFYYYRHPVSDFAPHVLYDALHVEGIIKCKERYGIFDPPWPDSTKKGDGDYSGEGKPSKPVFELFFVTALLAGLSSIAGVSIYLQKL